MSYTFAITAYYGVDVDIPFEEDSNEFDERVNQIINSIQNSTEGYLTVDIPDSDAHRLDLMDIQVETLGF